MTVKGHQERFPPPSLRDRCGFREQTFAGASGNDEDAPKPDLAEATEQISGSTHCC